MSPNAFHPPTAGQQRRYRITHRTVLSYAGAASASHNELRMTPVTEPGQTTLENRIRVRPMTWSQVYRDAWGTHVMAIEAITDHAQLTVESTSTVELYRTAPALPDEDDDEPITWNRLQLSTVQDLYYEWLAPTPQTTIGADLALLVRQAAAGLQPREAVQAVAELITNQLTFERGVTGVHTSADDAWMARRGVCQDFAHLTVGCLRELRIPARYVSGYLVPQESSEVGETSSGESHAWVEAWLGDWLSMDPTNGRPVALDHVVVARGRDYSDVPPFKGMYIGPKDSKSEVTVQFTRLS